jgi:uncharacterized membrane protein YkvI
MRCFIGLIIGILIAFSWHKERVMKTTLLFAMLTVAFNQLGVLRLVGFMYPVAAWMLLIYSGPAVFLAVASDGLIPETEVSSILVGTGVVSARV